MERDNPAIAARIRRSFMVPSFLQGKPAQKSNGKAAGIACRLVPQTYWCGTGRATCATG